MGQNWASAAHAIEEQDLECAKLSPKTWAAWCMHIRLYMQDRTRQTPVEPTVVIAEDNDVLRGQIARAVRDMGWRALEVRDGRELLDLLREQPSLVGTGMLVTDVRMPRVDGLEVLVELSSSHSRVPTVLITAFADDETKQMARALGASMVFSKPFDVDDLCTALQYLKQAQS